MCICYILSRFFSASGLFSKIIFTFSHSPSSAQSAQVSYFLAEAHCLIGQIESQKGVFTPSILHPTQLIISGLISTPFSLLQSFATSSRSSLSSYCCYASFTGLTIQSAICNVFIHDIFPFFLFFNFKII